MRCDAQRASSTASSASCPFSFQRRPSGRRCLVLFPAQCCRIRGLNCKQSRLCDHDVWGSQLSCDSQWNRLLLARRRPLSKLKHRLDKVSTGPPTFLWVASLGSGLRHVASQLFSYPLIAPHSRKLDIWDFLIVDLVTSHHKQEKGARMTGDTVRCIVPLFWAPSRRTISPTRVTGWRGHRLSVSVWLQVSRANPPRTASRRHYPLRLQRHASVRI